MKSSFAILSLPVILLAMVMGSPDSGGADRDSAAASPKPYPLTTCIVSDEKLGGMGKPAMIDYKGQQVGFCCKSCIGDFEKDPAKYLAKLPAK
jgi:hypothetical protein